GEAGGVADCRTTVWPLVAPSRAIPAHRCVLEGMVESPARPAGVGQDCQSLCREGRVANEEIDRASVLASRGRQSPGGWSVSAKSIAAIAQFAIFILRFPIACSAESFASPPLPPLAKGGSSLVATSPDVVRLIRRPRVARSR